MHSKRVVAFSILAAIVILSVSFASAVSFGDWIRTAFNSNAGVTGNVVEEVGQGSIVYQNSFSADSGLLNGAQIAAEGIGGRSAYFDGQNDYFVDSNFAWNNGGAVTVMFWTNTSGKPGVDTSIFGLAEADFPNRFQAHVPAHDRKLYWDYGNYVGNAGRISIDYTPYFGKWTHVTLVSAGNGGSYKAIYINGELITSSNAASDGPDVALRNLSIGRAKIGQGIYYHKGNVDEFAIYSSVLSAEEISSLYNSQRANLVVSSGSTTINQTTPANQSITVNQTQGNSSTPVTCVDSDGGLNYTQIGTTTNVLLNHPFTDFCSGQTALIEYSCRVVEGQMSVYASTYTCPNGCLNGACVSQPPVSAQVCSDVVSRNGLLYPERFGRFVLATNRTNGGNAYGQEVTYHRLHYEAPDFTDLSVDVTVANNISYNWSDNEDILESIRKGIWTVETVYVNGVAQQVYILGEENAQMYIWFNGNVLIEVMQWRRSTSTSADPLDAAEFVRALQGDSRFRAIVQDTSTYPDLRAFASEYLRACPSVVVEQCIPQWEQKLEPAVCPEHGYQTLIFRDKAQCAGVSSSIQEEQRACSPGICSGCMVPRWMGYNTGDNVCVPYGTRLGFERDSSGERIDEGFDGNLREYTNVTIFDTSMATLKVVEDGDVLFDETVREGDQYKIVGESFGEIIFRVDRIATLEENSGNGGYIDIVIIDSFDAYCNYDGYVQQQKLGEDSACQNNYECASNLCSSGTCVDIQGAIKEARGVKSLMITALCRITNLFDQDGYNQCLVQYLGAPSTPTTGSGGGSSQPSN